MNAVKDQRLPLSVIVPVYNVEPYLRRCLDSILHQSQPVQEIICVDDGSTDKSLIILQEYERTNDQVRVIHKKNGGLISARKAGLALATCPYATYVDSDDFIESEMYEDLMRQMLENDADVVTSGTIRDYGTHVVRAREAAEAGCYRGTDLEKLKSMLVSTETFFQTETTFHLVEKIFQTKLLRTFQNGFDERISVGEDVVVTWPFLLHAKCVYVSGKEYYHYCLRNDSIMGVKAKNDVIQVHVYLETLRKRLHDAQSCVPNIMEQFAMIRAYVLLLRDAAFILKTVGDILQPFGSVPKQSRIVLYGAGKFGNELKFWLDRNGYHVVLWVDKAENRAGVRNPTTLKDAAYDIVLIAALQADAVASIKENLRTLGVSDKKIRKIEASALKQYLS